MVSILGISAFYHDSAACLVIDGEIVAAAQEERFTRVKHDHNFPANAVRYCLSEAGITANDLDYVGFYENVYKAIIGEAELEVKPEQARNVIRVIELAMQSHKERCRIEFS